MADSFRTAWASLRDGVPAELALPLPAWLAAAAQAPLGDLMNNEFVWVETGRRFQLVLE